MEVITLIGKTTKFVVAGAAVLVVLSINDSWCPLYFVLGGCGNAVLSKLFKMVLKQPRPTASIKVGYGMPSSHTQALFYFLTVLEMNWNSPSIFLPPILFAYAAVSCLWRVVSGLHDLPQVLVGAVLGSVIGAIASLIKEYLFAMIEIVEDSSVPFFVRAITVISGLAFVVFKKHFKWAKKL